ncbi:hypothetical protein Tdes44962_MAKER08531 [Teratosphaeria destructans]|uniref:Uncharacterized protein n=1 Tax=Teratosphaeria destructans TaxID=418781 RepID=A0A9W7W4T2_9PEZI|nr:hypothetical protein Tdes44962_MAKER08531 [Teratosphaeria destructans]
MYCVGIASGAREGLKQQRSGDANAAKSSPEAGFDHRSLGSAESGNAKQTVPDVLPAGVV